MHEALRTSAAASTAHEYLDPQRVELDYEMPLAEIIFDFYDKLKSVTRGYATMDYEFLGYRPSDLVKLDILVNGDAVDALSVIIHRDKAYDCGRELARQAQGAIPRHMFEVALQAAIGAQDHRARDDEGRCARTSPRSATAATSRASASSSRSRRRARSG